MVCTVAVRPSLLKIHQLGIKPTPSFVTRRDEGNNISHWKFLALFEVFKKLPRKHLSKSVLLSSTRKMVSLSSYRRSFVLKLRMKRNGKDFEEILSTCLLTAFAYVRNCCVAQFLFYQHIYAKLHSLL
jgi:hypothetical protein